jgi:hypothetical protein
MSKDPSKAADVLVQKALDNGMSIDKIDRILDEE